MQKSVQDLMKKIGIKELFAVPHGKLQGGTVLATNGKTAIREEEWNYDAKKGIVVIGLKNEAVEGKVAWTKQGQDELMITYLYDEKVDTVETLAKVSASIKAYNTVETKIPLSHELTISQNEALGKMMESTNEALHK